MTVRAELMQGILQKLSGQLVSAEFGATVWAVSVGYCAKGRLTPDSASVKPRDRLRMSQEGEIHWALVLQDCQM